MSDITLLPTEQLVAPLRHVSEPSTIHGRVMDVINSRLDVVGPQSALSINDSHRFNLALSEPLVTATGVADTAIQSSYTRSAWRHVHERLRIPLGYADRLQQHEHAAVQDLGQSSINTLAAVDGRDALYRYLQTEEGLLLRAVRSDKFLMLDNDAALVAIVKGLQRHELDLWDCEIDADITPDRLRMRIAVPQIATSAKVLVHDYKSPFDGRSGSELPMLWAGLEFTNSETGAGAFQVSPRAVLEVCKNGMTSAVSFRRAHLGAALDAGEIDWSQETVSNALRLISSQVNDSVSTFLSTEWLDSLVQEMMEAKGMEIDSIPKAVEVVQKRMSFSDAETESVLNMMLKGGDSSVFGMSQAITAAAQLVSDGDRQQEMEMAASKVNASPAQYVGA